jgi:hypothetical protein
MRVKAIARGFDGTRIREEGDEFDFPDTVTAVVNGKKVQLEQKPGKWMEVLKPAKGSKSADSQVEGDEKLA